MCQRDHTLSFLCLHTHPVTYFPSKTKLCRKKNALQSLVIVKSHLICPYLVSLQRFLQSPPSNILLVSLKGCCVHKLCPYHAHQLGLNLWPGRALDLDANLQATATLHLLKMYFSYLYSFAVHGHECWLHVHVTTYIITRTTTWISSKQTYPLLCCVWSVG